MNNRSDEGETEALIQGYLESSLNERESTRLNALLQQNPAKVDLILSGLRDDLLIRTVVAELMVVSPEQSSNHAVRLAESLQWTQSILRLLRKNAWTTATVGVTAFALFVFLWLWCLGPTVGTPVLAEVQGEGISLERSRQSIVPTLGTSLRAGDILRTAERTTAVIGFAPEATRITLLPGTEFTLRSLSRGKRFDLDLGKLEASVARQPPFRPMILRTPQAEARVIGTRFTLTVNSNATRLDVTEGRVRFTRLSDSSSVRVDADNFAVAASNYVLAAQPLPGKVLREIWLDLPGDNVLDLRNHARFPNAPSERDFPPGFETNTNWPGAYGTRTRAYLLPPANGHYEFRLPENVRNGQIRLMLSPDDDPAGKLEICQIAFTRNRPGDESPRNISRSQLESAPIHLDAGRRYYIEALHKFGTGEDRLAILWKRPDGVIEPIPSECLAPFKGNAKREKR